VDPFMQGQLAVWLVRLGQEPWARDVSEPFATQLRGDVGASVLAWETIGCPYDAALALVDAPDESSWLEALPRLDALGATATADLLRRRLREAGARVPAGVRATTRSHPCGLTRREQEVLELVADGLTNLEVADRLFISAKTVDHHVSAVLGKLGVTNRRAAGLEAARLGLVEHGERVPTT
jgi:DNA-binding CsgD family transcriptional regulator